MRGGGLPVIPITVSYRIDWEGKPIPGTNLGGWSDERLRGPFVRPHGDGAANRRAMRSPTLSLFVHTSGDRYSTVVGSSTPPGLPGQFLARRRPVRPQGRRLESGHLYLGHSGPRRPIRPQGPR
jgi:hypothetical protein